MTDEIFQNPIFQDNEFNEAFMDFLNMRKKIKKPATERAVKLLLKKVLQLSNNNKERAIEIIDQSTVNCWQDLYQLKDVTFGNTQQGKKLREL